MQDNQRNDEMNLAWQLISATGISVFLTGKAGTGKTTFLHRLRELMPKRMVVLAPTGVAAINAGGQTVHSFFQLPFGPYIPGAPERDNGNMYKMSEQKKNLIRTLDLLVIDEVSMVRADMLDQIDNALRKYRDRYKPFGGVQLLLIGDLMQLSPVAKADEWQLLSEHYETPYFFSSHALQQVPYATVELQRIYRQQDDRFIALLGKVRNGNADASDLQALNQRYVPGFNSDIDGWIRLTTHNSTAQTHNEMRLARLASPLRHFDAVVKGEFPETSFPADNQLTLKEGAQVMFIKNDNTDHLYYNGKIGKIVRINPEDVEVLCPGDAEPIVVKPSLWDNNRYVIDPETKAIKEESIGTFAQLPLRLAWAITIHKSQGLTFDHAVLDVNASFAHGQTYVALSRCRTLEGLVLSSPIDPRSIITDPTIQKYIDRQRQDSQQYFQGLPQLMRDYTMQLLDQLFSFRLLDQDSRWLTKVVDERFGLNYHNLLTTLKATAQPMEEILSIAAQFRSQYCQQLATSGFKIEGTPIDPRIRQGCKYFADKLEQTFAFLTSSVVRVNIQNAQTSQVYNNALATLRRGLKEKINLLRAMAETPFSAKAYLQAKAKSDIDQAPAQRSRKSAKKAKAPANSRSAKASGLKAALDAGYRAGQSGSKAAMNGSYGAGQSGMKAGFDGGYRTGQRVQEGHDNNYASAKPNKPAAPKKKKGDTLSETLRLLHSGLTPAQIAEERRLAISTIFGHLAALVEKGLVDVNELVDPAHQRQILAAAEKMEGSFTLTDLRALLPDSITFGEIRLVLSTR